MITPDLLALIGTAFVVLIITTLLFFWRRSQLSESNEDERPRPVPRARQGVPRRAQMARNRGARIRANAAPQEALPSDDEPNRNDADAEILDGSKLGAKKKAKLEAKAEKKAQREAEEQQRAEKKKKDQVAEEERKKIEAFREAEEKRLEEEERKAKEEQERREHEEYLKMKEAFSIEEEGFEEGDDGNQMNLLQEFVHYIKNNKVVVIEDLAAHFKLKTQAAIDRIKDLQKDDILTGVIDDRGKFIYVSQEEMDAVAKFIRQRGRVSIAELAENSNKLINLTPVSASVN